ncbi:MAG: glucose-1-phosphate adenylyltransferase subunit GlgD [Clostridia bacterium]|nr:glucose-1-phosphate adenylyltransferase subunit GlgD [Clostridia bacterium]
MIDTMGLIFSSNNETNLGELEVIRSVAALPFAGRYRLIDFVLSGMVNSGIINVGVTTDYNYRSLLDHLGSGKPWDLARKKYGLFILPPFAENLAKYDDKGMGMILGAIHYLKRSQQKYVVVADCNNVCNIRFDQVVAQHKQTGADLTIVYQDVDDGRFGLYLDIEEGRVTGFVTKTDDKPRLHRTVGYYVFTKDLLVNILERCQSQGKNDIAKDILENYITKHNVCAYRFDNYLATITDVDSYYRVSMDLLDVNVRKQLFVADDTIFTKIKDKVPTRYLSNAVVRNSMVADGCVIDGTVENCILFRGVTVEKGANLKNCIIMQDTVISADARLSCAILDKNCVICKGKELVGQPEFPIVVGKRRTI